MSNHREQSAKYNNQRWRNVSKSVRRNTPYCVYTYQKYGFTITPDVVDHFIEAQDAPELFYHEHNLFPCCHDMHNQKTAKVAQARANGTRELIEWYRDNAPNNETLELIEQWVRNNNNLKE